MSYKEVQDLRKLGKLEEALAMANQDLEKDPSNIWNKRSIAWVYYSYLKKNITKDKFETFIDFLNKLNTLELPDDEKMVFDKCAYEISKLIYSFASDLPYDLRHCIPEIEQQKQQIYSKVNIVFDIIKHFHFTKPSESYTYLHKAFHKCFQNSPDYLQFADWWGFENFCPQDYLSQEFNGKQMPSIVEKAYSVYSKELYHTKDKMKIKDFLPKLDVIIKNHPDYQLYGGKGCLLLSLGDKNGAAKYLQMQYTLRNSNRS